MIENKSYRGVSLLSIVEKIYTGVLLDRVREVPEGLTDDEQGGFREEGRGSNFCSKADR